MTEEASATETPLATESERQKIDELILRCESLLGRDRTLRFELAQQAYTLSQASHYQQGLARSLLCLSICQYNFGQFALALQQAFEAHAHFQELNNPLYQGHTLVLIARVNWGLGNYAEALEHSLHALKLHQESGDPSGEVEVLNSLLLIYVETSNYDSAVAAGLKALAANQSIITAWEASDSPEKLTHIQTLNTRKARLLNDLAYAYIDWKHYSEGLTRAQEALPIAQKVGARSLEGYARLNMGGAQRGLGANAEARQCYEASLAIGREVEDPPLEIYSLFYLAEIYRAQQQLQQAQAYFHQALARAEATKQRAHLYRCHAALAELHESRQEWSKALFHYKQYHATYETVFNEDTNRKLNGLTVRHQAETARKEALIHQLRHVELKTAYRALQTYQQRLLAVEKMAALGRLTAGLAHDLNTPLAAVRNALIQFTQWIGEYETAIQDPEPLVEEHLEIAQDMQQTLQLATRSVDRAVQFVNNINASTRAMVPKVRSRFNVAAIIEETLPMLTHTLNQGHCTLQFEPTHRNLTLEGSVSRFSQIVTNLVLNAVEANAPKGGLITLYLGPTPEGLQLEVNDQGKGISAENLMRIFDPLFTTKRFGEAAGLGLTIVHDIVTGEFGGTITVVSQVDQGTTFTLLFPDTLAQSLV